MSKLESTSPLFECLILIREVIALYFRTRQLRTLSRHRLVSSLILKIVQTSKTNYCFLFMIILKRFFALLMNIPILAKASFRQRMKEIRNFFSWLLMWCYFSSHRVGVGNVKLYLFSVLSNRGLQLRKFDPKSIWEEAMVVKV